MVRTLPLVTVLITVLCAPIHAAPGLLNYQGQLTNAAKQPITTPIAVTFTFWDAKTAGNQLGSGFSDTDTVTPDSQGIYATMIGDDPANFVPASIFAADSVWLNVNVAGEDLVPRVRIASVGYAIKASSADTAAMASGLSPVLNHPGDRLNLGAGVWYEVGLDGRTYLYANGHKQGGPRWFHPTSLADNISPDGQNAYGPQVAMDNNGNAIIVWYQYDGSNNQIFKSEYRGGAWTHPAGLSDNISPNGQDASNPQVAMDENGAAIIVWQQSDGLNVQVFKSEYRGGVWTHPASLSDNISPNGQDASNPQVAMDNNGDAIIVWHQSDGSKIQIFKSEYRGGAWTNPSSVFDNISPNGQDATGPQVAMDNNGAALIVWQQSEGSRTQIFKSEYRAGAWTYPSGLSDYISPFGQNAASPKVAMDNGGAALIVWQQYDGSRTQIFKSEYRAGAWTHPAGLSDNISPDGQNAAGPQVAMNDSGAAIIVWYQYDGSFNQMFKSEYRGGAWTYPSGLSDNISPDGQSSDQPQVAMDSNGNAIIVWRQFDGAIAQTFKSEYHDGAWTYPNGLHDNVSPDGQSVFVPQVAMDDNGSAIIVWSQYDGSSYQIFKSECSWGF